MEQRVDFKSAQVSIVSSGKLRCHEGLSSVDMRSVTC